MENPTIQTDLAAVLARLESKIDKIDGRLTQLEIGQVEIKEKLSGQINSIDEKLSGRISSLDEKLSGQISSLDEKLSGQIKALDVKTEQLNTRVGNVEFASRGILIGIAVIVFGGFAMLFWGGKI
jgi:chromosome segregation ATPase